MNRSWESESDVKVVTHRVRRTIVAGVVVAIAATCATVLVPSTADAASKSTLVVVTSTTTKARPAAAASTKGRVVRNQVVTITKKSGSWVYTNRGWIPRSALSTSNHYADKIAAQHGLTVRYTNNQVTGVRKSVNTATQYAVGGTYVAGTRYIQLTTSAAYDGTVAWKRTVLRNVVQHEASHYEIWRRAGNATAKIAGGRVESMTDAYAWLYHKTSRTAGGYGFNNLDVTHAKAVHARPAR